MGSGHGGCAGTECLWTLFKAEIRIILCPTGHRPRQSDAASATGCCGLPAPVRAPRASRATRPLETPCSVRERFLSLSRLKSRFQTEQTRLLNDSARVSKTHTEHLFCARASSFAEPISRHRARRRLKFLTIRAVLEGPFRTACRVPACICM